MSFIDHLAKMPAGTPPAVQESTRRLMKLAVWFGGLGLLLPFVLPESGVLSNSALLQLLERLVPSAAKAASVAQYPNVVRVYFSLMLTLAPVLALYFSIWHEPWRTRTLPMEKFDALRKIACLGACIFMVGLLLCLALLIYFLPGTVSADSRGSRGPTHVQPDRDDKARACHLWRVYIGLHALYLAGVITSTLPSPSPSLSTQTSE
jgi:hypothetical protein